MTTSSHDKNKGAPMGFTDKDYIEALGLDPALEGKPEINKAIKASLRQQLERDYVSNGMSGERAKKMAMKDIK